ncbi:MAG: hypothetical protein Fur0044_24300 [Anaerolineae bacterium]
MDGCFRRYGGLAAGHFEWDAAAAAKRPLTVNVVRGPWCVINVYAPRTTFYIEPHFQEKL